MSLLAAIRADSVNLPLFLHVLGAMLVSIVLAAIGLRKARGGDAASASGASSA